MLTLHVDYNKDYACYGVELLKNTTLKIFKQARCAGAVSAFENDEFIKLLCNTCSELCHYCETWWQGHVLEQRWQHVHLGHSHTTHLNWHSEANGGVVCPIKCCRIDSSRIETCNLWLNNQLTKFLHMIRWLQQWTRGHTIEGYCFPPIPTCPSNLLPVIHDSVTCTPVND